MRDRELRLAALSMDKRALLVRRLAARTHGGSAPVQLPRRQGVNTFRTSFAQERVWFLEQITPASSVYNVAGAFRLIGHLDVGALRRSVEALVARHESLRTTFVAIDGRPLQVVSPRVPVSVRHDEREAPAESARQGAARAALAEEVARPFDVAHGPLLRLWIRRVSVDTHLVCLTMHHLVADAWSIGILVRELSVLYRDAVRGRASSLAPPPLQYADYAEWQRERYRGERGASLAAYWRRQLLGAPYLEIAAATRSSGRGAARTVELPPALVESVRALARREGVTAFVAALAAWQVLLARRTGHDDVTVVSPVAGRDRLAVADVVGFFVNLVALRTDLAGDPSFREALQRVSAVVREGLRHQDLPFEQVLSALGADRSIARPPISPMAFALEQAIAPSIDLPDLEVTPLPLATTTSKTDLALILREHERGIAARVEYDCELYGAGAVDDLLHGFVAGLERAVGRPEAQLSEIVPVTVSVELSGAPTTIWDRFVAQATRTPTAVAVRAGGTSLTYEGLRARALAIAAELAARGARRGTLVAVWGVRGLEWVAAMLGIWSRGAVYLPLEPRWPPARVAEVLRQSRTSIVLTGPEPPTALCALQAENAPWTLVSARAPTIAVDDDRSSPPAPEDVAYVIYTSGSTGVPKGAVIEHVGLLNHLEAKVALLSLGAGDRVAQTAAAAFDISLWQCLAALLVGGQVEILGDDVVRDPGALRAAIAASGVTVLEQVPALLQLLLETDEVMAGTDEALCSLRWLVVTGEALPPELCRRWLRRHPSIPLVNAYGPTECADDVTHQVVAMPPGDVLRIPIGRPIPGMTVHVLDERRQPVGAGEIGELWVGGIGVGRGYLHAAVQTADAFVTPDPFDGRPGTRLYRTGDRGRRRDDGAFEWLGRLDGQVKIHGMRIETEEVEVLLNAPPSVRGAVVMGHPSEAPTHLIAHVAGDPHVTGLAETLRRHLAERLPAAMVPSSFVLLDALPCTPNGKIDRRALAAPSASVVAAPAVDAHRRVPETPSERLLASLWREVLGVEVSSVDAGFFALGGDSLSTIRLVAVARRHGLVFSAQQVFEQPTLAGLAAVATTPVVRAAEQGAVVGEVPLTPIQRMLLVADLPDVDHYNMAMVLMVDERLCGPSLALAVEHLMRHHDVLRLRVVRDGDGWRARIAGLEGLVPHAHVDLSTASDGDAVAAIEAVAAELQASLRLGEGPILRVASFDLGAARPGRVLVIVHHLACDAASWPILLEDLATVYAQLERGEAIALPPKTTSYEAWARRLEDYAAAPERGRDRAYWRRECAEMGARLRRERDGVPAVADVARLVVELDEADTAHLLRAAAAAGVTMESVLLTALAVAVTKGCGEESVLVYLERHGRTSTFADLDVTRTVGWFTAVFPVCVRVADGHDAWATLAAVGRHLRGVPDGGLGWGAAAYGGNDTTAAAMLRGLPRPEVSLNFLGRVDPPRAAGWRRAPESPGPEVAPRGTRPTVLDVVGQIEAERLQVAWYYDALLLARALVEEHVETFRRVLRTLASPQASVGGARDAGRTA
jgi:amino acid adenylation domain-containing protein/non-ribosomal peptide synthase protein (TIGR01720 family)